jgi:DNA-binding response OmpR family regulator
MRILLVEDDNAVAETVRRSLARDGHEADLAPDARSARTFATQHPYDAILLDLNLPDASGFDLIGELRQANPKIPVLMLTGRTSKEDVVRGFEVGADDYITKPFDVRELTARLRAVTRRTASNPQEHIAYEDLDLDRLRREVRARGTRLRLTPKEFGVLERLLLEAGGVASRKLLLEEVWGYDYDPGTKVVDVQITHLRSPKPVLRSLCSGPYPALTRVQNPCFCRRNNAQENHDCRRSRSYRELNGISRRYAGSRTGYSAIGCSRWLQSVT